MHRIDTPTAQKDKFGAGKNGYTDGNPQVGTPATDLNAAMFDSIQEEICSVVENTGIALNAGDNTQLLTAIEVIINSAISEATKLIVPDVGELYFTTDLTNPNTKYTGTTWAYLGEGVTLRTAKVDGSDLNAVVGSDNIALTTENMPPHAHSIAGETGSSADIGAGTSAFDYGMKATDGSGAHNHNVNGRTQFGSAGSNVAMANTGTDETNTWAISSIGDHVHNVGIGAHDHYVTLPAHSHSLPAATEQSGAGAEISLLQKSINVAIWVRTA